MATEHKQVRVKYLDGSFIKVDVKMAPLLKELWKRNIATSLSCQENFPGIAWISFPNSVEAEKFAGVVYNLGDETLQEQVEEWEYKANLRDWNETLIPSGDTFEVVKTGFPCYIFSISVRFPVRFIKRLADRLRKASVIDADTLWDASHGVD